MLDFNAFLNPKNEVCLYYATAATTMLESEWITRALSLIETDASRRLHLTLNGKKIGMGAYVPRGGTLIRDSPKIPQLEHFSLMMVLLLEKGKADQRITHPRIFIHI